ncbi:hypothetical protein HW555_002699 [Spodoptera exigua]|uniref:Retrotransposon gag domain-containing protein n=1 Tax=Spodoptera exigua TaxID=7107 RepID=A0A835GRI4_SPOEX|nr:hypothetical protein HW555_002699 [Spodoptera exigua]
MDEVEYDEVRRRQPETPVRRSVRLEGRSTRAREDERRSRSRTRHEGRRGSTHHVRSRSRSTRGAGGGRLGRSRSRRRESYDDDDLRQKLRLLEDQLLKRNEQRRRDEATTDYRRSTSQARKIYTPPRSDARSPEHKKPTYSDQVNFFEEFTKFLKGRDIELFLSSSMNNVIPEFDPLLREQTIDVWLNKVDECAEIYNWNDKQTAHFALPKLTGHAKSWYQGLPSIKHSWLEWKRILRESFPSTENYAELLTEMLNRRTRSGESLEVYYFSKINLLNRCKIFGKQSVDCIVFGIEDKGVRLSAQAGKFDKPEDTLEIFKTVKNYQPRDLRDFRRDTQSKDTRPSSATSIAPRVNASVRSQPKGNLTCFNCNDPGPMSWQCRKPLNKCTDCNYLGHNSNDYPKKIATTAINDDEDDKYKIVIKVNGLHTPCQVDLGSGNVYVGGSIRGQPGMEYYLLPGEYQLHKGMGSRIRPKYWPPRPSVLHIKQTQLPAADINFGKQLTHLERQRCQDLLAKYKTCFSSGLHDLGFTAITEMEIHLLDSTPVLGINTAVHDVTKRTPTELLFGHKIGNPSDGTLNNISEDINEYSKAEDIHSMRASAIRVIKNVIGGTGKSKKLEPKCQGPYRIKSVLPNDRYLIVDTPITRKGRPYENVVSVDKIFPWMNFDAHACSSRDDSDN